MVGVLISSHPFSDHAVHPVLGLDGLLLQEVIGVCLHSVYDKEGHRSCDQKQEDCKADASRLVVGQADQAFLCGCSQYQKNYRADDAEENAGCDPVRYRSDQFQVGAGFLHGYGPDFYVFRHGGDLIPDRPNGSALFHLFL